MKTILLVEDDSFLVDIYSTKLKEAGFSVQIAIDGKEAFKKIKEDMPDLLLLDIVLPNFNGWEILRKIERDDELKALKVVILSNLGEKQEIEKGLKLGAARYLVKAHYTPSEVVEEVKKILNKL
ncbi:response regulator [Patescibacteria group bacterium]|nr:response regulator [Patescibacteria group bacterium]